MAKIFALVLSMVLSVLAVSSAYAVELAEVDEHGRCLNGTECGPEHGWYNRIPAHAQVSVSQQNIMVRFKWDEDPAFTVGEAFELSVTFLPHEQCKEGERYKLFASPFPDGTDWDSPFNTLYYSFTYTGEDGEEQSVPGAYRDPGNFTTEVYGPEVQVAVRDRCDGQTLESNDADDVALAIRWTADKIWKGKYQFAVGTSSPEFLKIGVWYTITYKLRPGECPTGQVVIVGQAIKDRNFNVIDCPYTNGTWDPLFGEQKECGCSREWINKLCVPTATFDFIPSEEHLAGLGCDDVDGDDLFGVEALSYNAAVPNLHFGSNVGDCNDCDGRIGTAGYQYDYGACVFGEVGEYGLHTRHDPETSAFVGSYLYHGGFNVFGNPSGYVHAWGTDKAGQPLLVQDFVRPSDGYWSMFMFNRQQGKVHPSHSRLLWRYAHCKNREVDASECGGVTDLGAPMWQETYCIHASDLANQARFVKQEFERGALCFDTSVGAYMTTTACAECAVLGGPPVQNECGGTSAGSASSGDASAGPAYRYLSSESCLSTSGGEAYDWRYWCNNAATVFEEGQHVVVLSGFEDLTQDHRFKAAIYRDGILVQEDGPTGWNRVGTGWDRAYYWAWVWNVKPGAYTARIFIQPGSEQAAFEEVSEHTFTVKPAPDYLFAGVSSCTAKVDGTASNGWRYACVDPRTTFQAGEHVITLAGLEKIRRNHRYRALIYRNGLYLYTDGPTAWNSVGTWGWERGYYWPTVWNTMPGAYRLNLEVDVGSGFKPLTKHEFTVSGLLYRFAGSDVCSRVTGPIQPGWYYNCEGSKTTFAYGETAYVLVGFERLTVNHRYKVVNYLNNQYQWEWTTAWNSVGACGWERGYFWPTFSRPRHGTWRSRIFIDTGHGFEYVVEKTFTVQAPPYEFMGAQVCHGVSGGEYTNWIYSCVSPATSFSMGEVVYVLAGFRNLTRDHRFMVSAWKDNRYQWNYTTDWNRVGEWGWDYAYFWPALWDSRSPGPGTWRFDISIDAGTGFLLVSRPTFTVK